MSLRWPAAPGILAAVLCGSGVNAQPEDWEPFLETYCFDCHDSVSNKGGIDFEAAVSRPLADHTDLWEKVLRQLQARMMPPSGSKRPGEGQYELQSQSLVSALDGHAAGHPDPGRTETLRRLTRLEYGNAIRDLLGIDVDVSRLLPADQGSHGFDNVTVGDLPPGLLDRYLTAARKISRRVVANGSSSQGRTVRVRPDRTQDAYVEGLPLGTRGGVLIAHTFPRDGEYAIRIHLMRDRDEKVEGLRGVHELQVLLDDAVAASFEVRPPADRRDHTRVDAHLATRIRARAGDRRLGVTFVSPHPDLVETLRQPYESAFNTHRHPRRAPAVYQVSIEGPLAPGKVGDTAGRRRLLGGEAPRDVVGARERLRKLIRLAYRGHGNAEDLARTMEFYREGSAEGGFEGGMEAALAAILVSPRFLFRVERDPGQQVAGSVYPLTDLELATRLSFFLWSSIPDDELLQAAARGALRDRAGREQQVLRMLADERARSLVENFASQWLHLRNLDTFTPDGRLYPDFDDNLRQAMKRETQLLFESVLREDRSVLDLLHSDHTFLNERLAKHYGIPHVYGERFRKVPLKPESQRGGLLRHASILSVTSYANRTSPVLRGHWVLENLFGTPPPPPPPDVPALEDGSVDSSLPVRQRLARHREEASCAGCHAPMDPIGFALKNFDAIGQWRMREGEVLIDASGLLPGGRAFTGVGGLEEELLKRPALFVRTLCEKLLTFGLGRGMEPSDAPAIRRIVREAGAEDYRFSRIILRIVGSGPFMMRRTAAE